MAAFARIRSFHSLLKTLILLEIVELFQKFFLVIILDEKLGHRNEE